MMTPDQLLEEEERRRLTMTQNEDELLKLLLKENGWERRMICSTCAYHVTNVPYFFGENEPHITVLKSNIANDMAYGGLLVGLPSVFWSTTMYQGGLPTISPYPTNGTPGQDYWRAKIFLKKFSTYKMWYCQYPKKTTYNGKKTYQVRLILAKEDECQYLRGIPGIIELKMSEKNPFLYYDEHGRWFTNKYDTDSHSIDYFVNFIVLKDFALEEPEWGRVTRSGFGPGTPLKRDVLSAALLRQWSAYRKHQIPNNASNTSVGQATSSETASSAES